VIHVLLLLLLLLSHGCLTRIEEYGLTDQVLLVHNSATHFLTTCMLCVQYYCFLHENVRPG